MNNLIEDLKKYFLDTPQEKIIEDWESSAEFDNVGPTVSEFLDTSRILHKYRDDFWCNDQNCDILANPKMTFGFLF